ncbi:hypothetical protein YPPY76_4614, partial [Yersinia pestis PY-76]
MDTGCHGSRFTHYSGYDP